jgi:glycosyltransferase involved in cell wall biosynthesis
MSLLTFVVPHDEEALIGDTLRTLRASADAAGEPYEIIVVNDASTDRTAAIAAAAGARVVDVNVRQIGAARNAGAKVASGDTLVFVDADTWVPPETVRAVIDARRAGAIGGGAVVHADEPMPRYARVMMPVSVWILRNCRWAGCFLSRRAKRSRPADLTSASMRRRRLPSAGRARVAALRHPAGKRDDVGPQARTYSGLRNPLGRSCGSRVSI